MLNIQSLAISLSFLSSSSLECVEGKVSNEKIQFAQTIIHNINMIESSIVEFMRKSKIRWCARGQTRPKATSIDPMFIEESKEDEDVEQKFVEAQTTYKDIGEGNVVEVKLQLSTKVKVELQQSIKV